MRITLLARMSAVFVVLVTNLSDVVETLRQPFPVREGRGEKIDAFGLTCSDKRYIQSDKEIAMEMLLLISLNIFWGVVLVNAVLILRVIRWIRVTNETRVPQRERAVRPELMIGASAPEFKARTLAGQPIRLDNYARRAVVFIFVSPHCESCRREMSTLTKLGPLAKKNVGVEMILVSCEDSTETQSWLDKIRTEDRVDVTLPVLIAPRGKSDFLEDYNPSRLFPGFCLLDEQGMVQARGPIPSVEWWKLKRNWEGITRPSSLMLNQYR